MKLAQNLVGELIKLILIFHLLKTVVVNITNAVIDMVSRKM